MVALRAEEFWREHTTANLAGIRAGIADAWRPREIVAPSEWCQKHLRLDPQVEATERFDLTGRPWWKDILDTLIDPEVRYMSVAAATQVGKTLLLVAMIIWCAVNAPAPAMVVTPDKDSAIELRDRVYANARKSPELRHLVPPERQWNTRWIDLGTMRVYLAWSGSRQRLRGRRCKYVFLTETDAYQGSKVTGDPIKAARERTKSYFRFFVYAESSPVEDPSPIAAMEAASDERRRWHATCPKCGRLQELRFFTHRGGEHAGKGGIGGLHDDEGKLRTATAARKNAHYICEAGCRIDEDQRLDFIATGKTHSTGDAHRSCGAHLWSVHSDVITFADLAAAYIEHRAEGKLAEFYGNWLGLSFKQNSKLPTWKQLGERLRAKNRIREVPPDVWFLTAGGDTQGDRIKYSVRGWAPECTSYLIDCGELERKPGDENDLIKSDLAQIEKTLLTRKYPIVGPGGVNPLGKRELAVKMFGLDTGGNRTMQCYEWWRSLPDAWKDTESGRVRLLKGSAQLEPNERWKHSELKEDRDGEVVYDDPIDLWLVGVALFYQDLTERLQGQPDKPGAWHVTSDALSIAKEYLQEVCNFHRVVEIRNGQRKPAWRPRSESIPNDYWDTEIYSLAMAHMVVGSMGWSEAAWNKWWARKQDTPRRNTPRRRSDAPSIADR